MTQEPQYQNRDNAARIAKILPMLEAMALGLRIKIGRETWTLSDDMDLVLVEQRTTIRGGTETTEEIGILPMRFPSLAEIIKVLESATEESRCELVANLALNRITADRFSLTKSRHPTSEDGHDG